jgi:hypothetical protein
VTAVLDDLTGRVGRGADRLDRYLPGWGYRIDPDRLDMGCSTGVPCLLCQLYGPFNYDNGIVDLGGPTVQPDATAWAVAHGFTLDTLALEDAGHDQAVTAAYAQLTDTWRAELARRRGGAAR